MYEIRCVMTFQCAAISVYLYQTQILKKQKGVPCSDLHRKLWVDMHNSMCDLDKCAHYI